MSMMKKLLPLALWSITMVPFYDAMASVEGKGSNVYVPHLRSDNEVSAGAVFLRPGGSNDYGVLVSPFNPQVASPILSPSWQPEGINPKFSPGFSVSLRHV